MQYFADACTANRAVWQERWEKFQAVAAAEVDTGSTSSKPVFAALTEPCLTDDRYKSLFPMSLPMSMISSIASASSMTMDGLKEALGGERGIGLDATSSDRSGNENGNRNGAEREQGQNVTRIGDQGDKNMDPAQAIRMAYRQSIRRQTSKIRMSSRKLGHSPRSFFGGIGGDGETN